MTKTHVLIILLTHLSYILEKTMPFIDRILFLQHIKKVNNS